MKTASQLYCIVCQTQLTLVDVLANARWHVVYDFPAFACPCCHHNIAFNIEEKMIKVGVVDSQTEQIFIPHYEVYFPEIVVTRSYNEIQVIVEQKIWRIRADTSGLWQIFGKRYILTIIAINVLVGVALYVLYELLKR